jgi:flagellar biosynthesis protein
MEHQGRRRAAALHYTRGQGRPTLVAKGDDEVAEQIVAVAREHGVPIHQDPALVGVLSRLDLDDQIPTPLFVAVASVLAFIYQLQADQEAPQPIGPNDAWQNQIRSRADL